MNATPCLLHRQPDKLIFHENLSHYPEYILCNGDFQEEKNISPHMSRKKVEIGAGGGQKTASSGQDTTPYGP